MTADLDGRSGWQGVRGWLRTSDSDWFHDEAVLGGLPLYEAEELLLDYGIRPTADNLRRLGRELDESLMEGR
jgi:hypothetical protein